MLLIFFLIGLNERDFIERLSVKFSCLVFFPLPIQNRQLSSFPKRVPSIEYSGLFVIQMFVKKCNLNLIYNFSAVLC